MSLTFLEQLKELQQFEKELMTEIEAVSTVKTINEGQSLMEIGQRITHMPLLISGALKIMQEDEDGEELVLYFIERGDTCAMTMNCCFGDRKSRVRAVAEIDTELLLVPTLYIDEWMAKYASWRQFILNSYNQRFTELLKALDSVAFLHMDQRLVNYLEEKSKVHATNLIKVTHQEIAYDLHTSRVVISRLLKRLEKEGFLQIHRNQIELL